MEDRTSSEVWLNAGCKLSFEVKVATPMIFMLRPRSGPSQWVAAEGYDLLPSLPVVGPGSIRLSADRIRSAEWGAILAHKAQNFLIRQGSWKRRGGGVCPCVLVHRFFQFTA